jgi:mannose-6-phosphate isomerase-like protein (cupin superfamily)
VQNPVTKERFTIARSGPEALLLEVRVPPDMIRPPLHLHRGQRESFEVRHGRVTVRTGREEHVLEPGGRLDVPSGTPHTWWNSGDGEAVILAEFRPPGQARSFFETFCGMAGEGRCDAKGGPPLLQIAASARLWDMYLAGPPVPLQRALFAALGPLARMRGYRASYERFEHAG